MGELTRVATADHRLLRGSFRHGQKLFTLAVDCRIQFLGERRLVSRCCTPSVVTTSP
jgi:hypothetical protein